MNDETQQTDAGRLEKEEIEDLGTVTLARGEHVIHCLDRHRPDRRPFGSAAGPEDHEYEHVIPQLVAAHGGSPHRRACWCC